MSGNSSASSGPPKDEEEYEPLKTDEELIEMLKNARADERLPIETQLRLNHTLEAARDPFGRTNVERREWERKNGAGGGGAGGRAPKVTYNEYGHIIPARSPAAFNAIDAANRAAAANQTIYFPPAPPPPPAAPVTVAAPAPVTTTGAGPATAAAAATATETTEEPTLRRRGAAARREANDNTAVQQRDPRTRKSFCEKLGDCSIQGGSRKSRKGRSRRVKKSRKSKKSKAAKKSKKSNRATRKH
jgi:hypothetical protein